MAIETFKVNRPVSESKFFLGALLLLLSSCSASPRPEPGLETQFKELTAILDSTIKEFQVEVTRTEDRRSPECTTNIGWTNTGKYKQARSIQGTFSSQPDLRALVQRIGDRWRSDKFAVTFFQTRDGSILSVTARDDWRGSMDFSTFTTKNYVSLSTETICLKP